MEERKIDDMSIERTRQDIEHERQRSSLQKQEFKSHFMNHMKVNEDKKNV